MYLKADRYVVITKSRPIQFEMDSEGHPRGELTSDFNEAYFYITYDHAAQSVKSMDDEDNFEVLKVESVCNF